MHPRGNLSRGSGLHDNPHQGNETNQVETEAGEECPGAATGTSETWSKTSTHAVDTTRPGPLNADLRSVYGQGGLALFTHEARLSTCENECLSEKICGTCWYLHTLCCTIKLMVCRVAGMCVWWCVPAWALSLCLLSQTHLPHKKITWMWRTNYQHAFIAR